MIITEVTIECPFYESPHKVELSTIKRKRVSDVCEVVKAELEEVRPKAKKQKIQSGELEEDTIDGIINRGRKQTSYSPNKKLHAKFRRLSQQQREEILQKEQLEIMKEEYTRKEIEEREYQLHKAEIEKQKLEAKALKEALKKQREYEHQQQVQAEKMRTRQQARLTELKEGEERKKQEQIKRENVQESIIRKNTI